jgi:hypothetical protein
MIRQNNKTQNVFMDLTNPHILNNNLFMLNQTKPTPRYDYLYFIAFIFLQSPISYKHFYLLKM